MKTLLLVVVLLVTLVQARISSHAKAGDWGYGDNNGPDTWPDSFPTCGGNRQSPVALNTQSTEVKLPLTSFTFVNYNAKPSTVTLTNTGHSVQVNLDVDAWVKGGSMNDVFTFSQFHFHWGGADNHGSEHTVDNARFPGELHMVHYRQSYGSWNEAVKHEDGVAVLSVLLELSPTDNPNLQPIIDGLMDVILPFETSFISTIFLQNFLPSNLLYFFTYSGSLTTPLCNEVVAWTVFRNTIPISSNQLKQFRKLIAHDGSTMQDNFRSLQSLNDREVYRSWI